ncbi:TetR/AcrR family transcriptional regulator [Actinomadura citrea]|uniref:AcrR family transcriptional regulator n=1 Tax=Actinomadura citrea TaxID=46158 RepID=A0A7Y9G680_9ACTN|nr:TetR/AcrR family transcriptional regulator [Actinomadura citrea]NYE10740.1 AcrR family transcriptional regulator [Actinomadura citrea]GGT74298.1 TetR family transcriptional regulator [Actinomadura citrea]
MARPRARDYDELRQDLLDAAGRLLAQEGPQALSTRRLAREVRTSTTAVYNLYGDKAGLLRAMFLQGFARLADTFAAVPTDGDPETDLMALGQAYRTAALANPHLYELMFGRPIADFRPDEAALAQIQGTFDTLVRAVARCIDSGWFAPADPHDVAAHLNALVHGLASLELLGSLGPRTQADRYWRIALEAAFRGHRAPMPGSP